MKIQMASLIFISILLLTACGPQAVIEPDREQTRIIVDKDNGFITFFVRLENQSRLPSNKLFAKFNLLHDELIQELATETVTLEDDERTPHAFSIDGNGSYFFGETFDYHQTIPFEELKNAVEVVVFDEEDDDILRFAIDRVEEDDQQ